MSVIRPGWYSTSTSDAAVVAAVRSGGVVGCVSALEHHGIWVPPGRVLHVRASDHRRRVDSRIYCSAHRELPAPRVAVDPLLPALACAARCLPGEDFIAACDSVLHQHPELQMSDLGDVLSGAPARVHRLLDHVDPRAESGTESLVRIRLRRRNVRLDIQVTIRGVGRVDILIGRSLIVEVDSVAHHTGDNYQPDRTRDQKAKALGYEVVRLTWHDVLYRWEEMEQGLLRMIRRGDHLGRRLAR